MAVRRGFYQHYKGDYYFVESVGVMHDDTRRIVVYQSTQSAADGVTRLRYEDEFEQWVQCVGGPEMGEAQVYAGPEADESVLRHHGWRRRFERVGEAPRG
jgi:hypothetical protein